MNKNNNIYYRPQRRLGQGYVFTRVCDSVHRGGVVIPARIAGGIPACLAGLWGWYCRILRVYLLDSVV